MSLITQPPSHRRSKWWLILIAIVLIIVGLIVAIVIAAPNSPASELRAFVVPASSMEPTIMKGDHIIADINYYRLRKPTDGDIVLFRILGVVSVKRIIASGGEAIRGRDGAVFVNENLLAEPYVQHIGNAPQELTEFGPVLVPSDSYFVMGDNRDLSPDSRSLDLGCISADTIVGRPVRVLFNSRVGRFGRPIQ